MRLAARIVDTPPEEMGTIALEAEARAAAERLAAAGVPVEVDVIAGEALRDGGYGGLWGVGKAATERPAPQSSRTRRKAPRSPSASSARASSTTPAASR